MGITFNTNLSALTGQRYIGIASNNASSSLAKLSSGSRVPQAKDDAAGLSIGSKLKAEVAALTQNASNAGQAISLLQIADGALSTVGDILQRMKALAVQSSSGQLADADRSLLNQEFVSLQEEVDRVAATANFNGTNLLSGSTKVEAKVNDLTSNLIGQGFKSIDFSQSFGDGAIKVEYDATGGSVQSGVLTVTDLVNNKTQSITLDTGAIAVGDTETYNFGDIGVKITLGSNFNKLTDIAAANTVATSGAVTGTANIVGLQTSVPAAITQTVTVSGITLGGDGFTAGDLAGAVIAASGTYDALTFDDVTINGHVFSTTDVADTSGGTGPYAFTFTDAEGNNSFTVNLTLSGTGASGTVSSGGVTLAVGSATGVIEATGTGANAPALVSFTETAAEDANGNSLAFNFGAVDNAVLNIDAATNTAATGSIILNGVTFSTQSGDEVNLNTTGIKTLHLEDDDGNGIDVQFNVTTAFASGNRVAITLAQLGQVVGADSITSGGTEFSFKVGTGTTTNDDISFELDSATTTALGINSSSIGTADNANTAITAVTAAITTVSSLRADVGAAQSRLGFAAASINVAIENTTAAQSSLLDVDVSAEMTKFSSQQVLLQAGISLLAQANQQPSLLLRLLQ